MIKRILIYNTGGGLGDSIQLFPLILSLQNHFKLAQLYFLSAHSNHFTDKLKEYNIKVKNLDLETKYFGFRWWHFLITKRNFIKEEQDIKTELDEIKKIEMSFYGKYIDPNPSSLNNLLRKLIRFIFGKKLLNFLSIFLISIGNKIKRLI